MPGAEPVVACAGVSRTAPDRYRIDGALDFSTVPRLWKGVEPLISRGGRLTLSLEGVRTANSAGLALLLESLDVAKQREAHVDFTDIPDDLRALAALSGVESLLG